MPELLLESAELWSGGALAAAPGVLEPGQWSAEKAELALRLEFALGAALDPLEREASRLEREAFFLVPGADKGAEGESISLVDAFAAIAGERNRDRRIELERLRSRTAMKVMGDNRLTAVRTESALLKGVGGGSIDGALALLSSAESNSLPACDDFLRRTRGGYLESIGRLSRDRLRLAPNALSRSDVLDLFLRQPTDRRFDPADLQERSRGLADDIGLGHLLGALDIDLVARPGKRPRAATIVLDVAPREIAIVAWPMAGLSGVRGLFHEMGHGFHLAAQGPDSAPLLVRSLDRAVAEGWAILFGSIVGEPAWLRRQGLSREEAKAQARDLAVADLFLARRYAARWPVELAMLVDPGGRSHGEAYAEGLRAGTGIAFAAEEALFDRDVGLAGIEYLRGWALAAAWSVELRDALDEDWYCNPRAGEWLIEAMRARTAQVDWAVLARWLMERVA